MCHFRSVDLLRNVFGDFFLKNEGESKYSSLHRGFLVRGMYVHLFFRLGDPVALAAPTGLAAHNIHGTTLHSLFKIFPAKPGLKEEWKSLDRGQIKEMKNPNLKLLIVDEVL